MKKLKSNNNKKTKNKNMKIKKHSEIRNINNNDLNVVKHQQYSEIKKLSEIKMSNKNDLNVGLDPQYSEIKKLYESKMSNTNDLNVGLNPQYSDMKKLFEIKISNKNDLNVGLDLQYSEMKKLSETKLSKNNDLTITYDQYNDKMLCGSNDNDILTGLVIKAEQYLDALPIELRNHESKHDDCNHDVVLDKQSNNKKNIKVMNNKENTIMLGEKSNQTEFKKVDIRDANLDIKIKNETSIGRELTLEDIKKIKRYNKEEETILQIHSDLKEQEEMFLNSLPSSIKILSQPIGLITKLMDFQLYGISWMKSREDSIVRGGILADEMGMGKTLQALGLILSSNNYSEKTLIVTPAISLNQWITEIEKHAPDSFIVISHHGRNKIDKVGLNRKIKESELANYNKFIIILTTYGTLESDYRRKGSFLCENEYYRIIIDEAHTIKDSASSTCSAVSSIKALMRWGLTGTPVQNRIGDLFSLVKYLRLDPHSFYFCKRCPCKSLKWLKYDEKKLLGEIKEPIRKGFCTCGHFGSNHFSWWNRRISSQIKNYGYTKKGDEVFLKLSKITSHIILRRTKKELEKELGLPPKIVNLHRYYFSAEEKDFYTSLYTKTQTKFMSYAITGQVNTHYMHIFELLQKMRLAVNHPFLALKNVNEGIPICGFCNEEADDPVISKCKHIFCRAEAREFLQSSNLCPVCKLKITIDLTQEEDFSIKSNKIYTENWTSSTKIEFLVEELTKLKSNNHSIKSIVFSQFVNFLELLRWRLERAGFRCVNIYGSMTLTQRKVAIETFNNDKEITVFLISLKAGGLALNLTAASNVFLMDLWWNPAVEEQAMDRIHRIGQHRPITITRIIIEDSIESRVLKLQEKKKALFDTAIDNDKTALGKLTEDDLFFLFSN